MPNRTMRDIAVEAGVSSSTVSRVLSRKQSSIPISKETRERVLAIAERIGYRPNVFAKSLRTKKSYLVGVVLWDLTDPFYSDILRGVEQVLDETGYTLLLTTADAERDRGRPCLEKLVDFQTDGVLIVGGPEGFCEQEIRDLGVEPGRILLVDTRAVENDISSITVDNETGGYIGAEYLIKLGHRNITYIAGKEKTIDIEDRLQGVLRAVETYQAGYRFTVVEAGPGEREGYDATVEILARATPPLALFCVNDLTALGALRAVGDSGLSIPGEVAVLGFDDLLMSGYLQPRLSTVHQPRLEMGRDGAAMLIEQIDRSGESGAENRPSRRILSPLLVKREST